MMDSRDSPRGHQPLFSVILPCRGRAVSLTRALKAVMAQTESDWEAIVVDDASTEPLGPVVGRFEDPRLRCLRLERNLGPAGAREAALGAAKGRYAAFLDSDDVWAPEALAWHRSRLEDQGRRVSVAGAIVGRSSPRRIRPARASRPGERIATYLFIENEYAQMSGVSAPLHVARSAGFGNLRQYEDWYFLIRAEALGAEVEVSDAPLVIRDDDDTGDRMGATDDLGRAEAFLAAMAGMLRPEERNGFELRCLAPTLLVDHRRDAVRLVLRTAWRHKALRGAAAKLLLRAAVGPTRYAQIRTTADALRAGWRRDFVRIRIG